MTHDEESNTAPLRDKVRNDSGDPFWNIFVNQA
jgi:hypothetical protein